MARPRVFVSSTYYDLKHIRASLEVFIESLGFEPILSEIGSIPYDPSQPLDESCYREAETADILVLIVGGRYGSQASTQDQRDADEEFERSLESVTRKEFTKAYDADVPVYVLIENGVLSEYQTYLRNKSVIEIAYAHVDSPNVFKFIDFIYSKQRNNPVHSFEKGADIEDWLKEQWAGLFQEMLRQNKDNSKLSALSSQIRQLEAVNATLKSYLETVLQSVSPEESAEVIQRENKVLSDVKIREQARQNNWIDYMCYASETELDSVAKVFSSISSVNDIPDRFSEAYDDRICRSLLSTLHEHEDARSDFNKARAIFGMSPVRFTKTFLSKIEEYAT